MSEEISKKVLVLEDDQIFAFCLGEALSRLGYSSVAVDNVEEARNIVNIEKIYAAILDNEVRGIQHGPPLRSAGLDFGIDLRKTHPELRIALHTISLFEKNDIDYLASQGITYFRKMVGEKDLVSFLESK